MSYYQGDYYRGDYYRGDFWSKIGKGIKKLGKNIGRVVSPLLPVAAAFIPGVGGLVSKGLAIKAKAENVVKAYTQPLAGPLATVSKSAPLVHHQGFGVGGVTMLPPVPGAVPMPAPIRRAPARRAPAKKRKARVRIVYRYRTRPKKRRASRR